MGAPKLTKLTLWGDATSNFDAEARAYRHPHSGKQYPSVTSILKMADKSGLAQWAANLSVDWCVKNVDKLLSMDIERGIRVGRYRWKDVRDERAEVGTGVHEWVEAEHTGSWDYPQLDWEQKLIIAEWHAFCEEHDVKPMLSEFTVANEVDGYLGTADGYWWIDGKRCLVDLKTSRSTWPEHDYQLAALWKAPQWLIETEDMIWTTLPAREVDDVVIIHLRAPEFDEYGREIKPGKHDLISVKHLEENYRIFKAYADVWYGKQDLKDLIKDEELTTDGF